MDRSTRIAASHPTRVRPALLIEPLESRELFSVTTGSDGWTVVAPSSDTRTVYVSSSAGKDTNNGLSANSPVKTLAKGKSLIRNDSADHLLLKRGDTWHEALGQWWASGRSAQEPILISAYGTGARPLIDSGTDSGITTCASTAHRAPVNNVDIISLQFHADTYNGSNGGWQTAGIRLINSGSNWLVEDTKIWGYRDDIDFDAGSLSNITLRRSEILDAYNAGKVGNGHAQGLYSGPGVHGLLIEQNVFDHNGWNTAVAGAGRTMFNHDLYIQFGGTGITIRDNIISRGSLHGIMLRPGGTVQNNLIVQNAVGILVGGDATHPAAASTITGNVILQGSPDAMSHSDVGINVNEVPSLTIADNVIAHDTGGVNLKVIDVSAAAQHVSITGNTIYGWRGGIINSSGGSRIAGNEVQGTNAATTLINQSGSVSASGVYRGNAYYSPQGSPFRDGSASKTMSQWASATGDTSSKWQQVGYAAPDRDLGTYDASMGKTGTTDAFLAAARNMSKGNWDARFTAAPAVTYIRDGFLPVMTVTAPRASAAVGGVSTGTFRINRSNANLNEAVTVRFRLGGSAVNGVNYAALPTQVTIAAGQAGVNLTVKPIGSLLSSRTVTLTLLDGSGDPLSAGYTLGSLKTSTITIA